MGRRVGESSVVVETGVLKRFAGVHFDDKLKASLGRRNLIVAYPLGDQQFLCMEGLKFAKWYRDVLQKAGVQSNL